MFALHQMKDRFYLFTKLITDVMMQLHALSIVQPLSSKMSNAQSK